MNRLGLSDNRRLAAILDCEPELLQTIIRNKSQYYGSFFRDKDDGTKREITPPFKPLLAIQHNIKEYLKTKLAWTQVVHGGVPKRSIVTNARPHVNKVQVVNLDISKFFPSVKPVFVQSALERAGCAVPVASLLMELVTYKDGLPQGSPTSTIIGNLVLEPMDSKFMAFCRKHGFIYTRYVDDVTISGNVDMRPCRQGLIDIIRRAGYIVSDHKVQFTNRDNPQVVTGLVVNDRLRPTKDFLQELRGTIRRCWPENEGLSNVAAETGLLPHELLRKLRGRVSHVKSVDRASGRKIRGLMVKIFDKSQRIKYVPVF